MIIALVGLDGAGKTTVARALERLARDSGKRFLYIHGVPRPWSGGHSRVPDEPRSVAPKRATPVDVGMGHQLLSVIRLARNIVRYRVGVLAGIRRTEPGYRSDDVLLVADRWTFTYIGQPRAMAYFAPERLAWWALSAMPKADMAVLVDVPGEVAVARKAEVGLKEARQERARWIHLAVTKRMVVVDGTRPAEDTARQVWAEAFGSSMGTYP